MHALALVRQRAAVDRGADERMTEAHLRADLDQHENVESFYNIH